MKKNKIYRYIVPALLAAAVLAAAVWLFLGARRTVEEVPAAESGSGLEEGQVLYNGITYEYRDDLRTYLFLGVDNQEEQLEEERPGQAGQADCILVFVCYRRRTDRSPVCLWRWWDAKLLADGTGCFPPPLRSRY